MAPVRFANPPAIIPIPFPPPCNSKLDEELVTAEAVAAPFKALPFMLAAALAVVVPLVPLSRLLRIASFDLKSNERLLTILSLVF